MMFKPPPAMLDCTACPEVLPADAGELRSVHFRDRTKRGRVACEEGPPKCSGSEAWGRKESCLRRRC